MAGDRRHRPGRSAVLGHQPAGQRLVRPPRRRHQRPPAPHPFGPHAGPVGPVPRHRLDRRLPDGGAGARTLGVWRRGAGPAAGLGLQRAAGAPERERLVGQRCLRHQLRRHCLGDGRGGDGRRRDARRRVAGAGGALQRGHPRDHDPQRLQGRRWRPPDGRAFAAGAAGGGPGRARGLLVHGAAAGGGDRPAAALGPARPRCRGDGAAAGAGRADAPLAAPSMRRSISTSTPPSPSASTSRSRCCWSAWWAVPAPSSAP